MQDITIKSVLNGWVVKVGCCSVVFTDMKTMCKTLERYYEDPKKMEKEYRDKAVNKSCVVDQTAPSVFTVGTGQGTIMSGYGGVTTAGQ